MKGGKDNQETKIGAKLLFVRNDQGPNARKIEGPTSLMAFEILPHRGGG